MTTRKYSLNQIVNMTYLQQLRLNAGLSLRQLAQLTGLSKSSLHRMETRGQPLNKRTGPVLAKVFELDDWYLLLESSWQQPFQAHLGPGKD